MVRSLSSEKLDRILTASLFVFIDRGYRGTRIEMVAERAGVSLGTIYRYVDGKEALFELTIRTAFGDTVPEVHELPHGSRVGSKFVDWLWERLVKVSPFHALRAAAATEHPADAEAEFVEVIEETWDWQSRYWRGIELVERMAREWPELDLLFYRQFRRELFDLAAGWIGRRIEQGLLLPYPDAFTATRTIVETITFFAMHRHVRPDSDHLDESTSYETVMTLLRRGFVPGAAP